MGRARDDFAEVQRGSGRRIHFVAMVRLDDFHVEAEAFYDLGGEQTLMFYSVHGRGQQSGAVVAMPGAQVGRWRDELLVYAKVYVRREDALKELGVSEDSLEPVVP